MISFLNLFQGILWSEEAETEPQVNPFIGPKAELLFELYKLSISKRLLDRSEAGHMDIESRRELAEMLLGWYEQIKEETPTEYQKTVDSDSDIELRRKTRLLCIEKRLFELCESEKDWFFEMDVEMREKITDLLRVTAQDTRDPSIMYYKKSLLA